MRGWYKKQICSFGDLQRGIQKYPADQRIRDDEVRLYRAESDVAFGYLQEERFDDVEKIMGYYLTQCKIWDTEDKIPMSLAGAFQEQIRKTVEFATRGVELVIKSAGKITLPPNSGRSILQRCPSIITTLRSHFVFMKKSWQIAGVCSASSMLSPCKLFDL